MDEKIARALSRNQRIPSHFLSKFPLPTYNNITNFMNLLLSGFKFKEVYARIHCARTHPSLFFEKTRPNNLSILACPFALSFIFRVEFEVG